MLFSLPICRNRNNLRRTQRIFDENGRIVAPVDDVDLLAAQFVHDGVDSLSVHSDTCSYRIHIRIIGPYGNLCTGSCFSCNALDLNNTVFHLSHLGLKETFYKLRMGTGYEDLRSFCRILYFYHVKFDTALSA